MSVTGTVTLLDRTLRVLSFSGPKKGVPRHYADPKKNDGYFPTKTKSAKLLLDALPDESKGRCDSWSRPL